jgi:putative DNA primase/helicase
MPIGDDWNHARLFMVHVGRSSRGRKGTAKKLIYRINSAVKSLDEFLVPQVHRGGLSTREGLALMIHDGYLDGKNEVPAIEDKRLLVVESEFANILHQSKRDGNTLSAALRDAWDGTSIRPAVKTCRVWATDPHIGIIADVTPSELRELMHKRELTNGFANRFIFFWAEGDKILPFPEYTPKDVVETLASRVAEVLRFAGADRHVDKDVMRMEFSPEAASLYARLYKGELRDRSAGEHITGLLDRRAPVLLRLAMLFALTDQTSVITVDHVNAAMAWVRYWVDSVKFIFQSAMDEAGAATTTDTAQRIISHLAEHGQASRTELSKSCFNGHVSKASLDAALDELLTASPPVVEVQTVPRPKGQTGTPSKYYRLCAESSRTKFTANSANSAECGVPCGFAADIEPVRNVRTELTEVDSPKGGGSHFAQFSDFADPENPVPTRMNIDTSQISHISPGVSVFVTDSGGLDNDIEVF